MTSAPSAAARAMAIGKATTSSPGRGMRYARTEASGATPENGAPSWVVAPTAHPMRSAPCPLARVACSTPTRTVASSGTRSRSAASSSIMASRVPRPVPQTSRSTARPPGASRRNHRPSDGRSSGRRARACLGPVGRPEHGGRLEVERRRHPLALTPRRCDVADGHPGAQERLLDVGAQVRASSSGSASRRWGPARTSCEPSSRCRRRSRSARGASGSTATDVATIRSTPLPSSSPARVASGT